MLELTRDDVAPDQELGMAMRAKTGALLYAVLVDDTKRTIILVAWIIVRSEAEGVETVQPAVVSKAALIPWSLCDFQIAGRGHSPNESWAND